MWGVGLWGINVPFVWGFDLINYAWWIGIANGASLFAAILVLRRHDLRTAVNRFAEAVALFGVVFSRSCTSADRGFSTGFFPTPRPTRCGRSSAAPSRGTSGPSARTRSSPPCSGTWGSSRISRHCGTEPAGPLAQRVYGVLALGWRNSVRHWTYHQAAYRLVAILVLPLILIMQSTVAFEFASTLVPDWHETRLPLHFVATGLAQGLSMVLLIAMLLRWGLRLERHIDDQDVDLLGKLVVASALASGYLYLDEIAAALLSEPSERLATLHRVFGDHAGAYWAALTYCVIVPQLLWLGAARRSVLAGVFVGLSISAGVWFDRFSIIVGGLQRDYLPSMWRSYAPTLIETGLLVGTVGLFATLLLLFVRFLPVVSMFESRHDEHEDRM